MSWVSPAVLLNIFLLCTLHIRKKNVTTDEATEYYWIEENTNENYICRQEKPSEIRELIIFADDQIPLVYLRACCSINVYA